MQTYAILLVEDDPNLRRAFQAVVERAGYLVHACAGGAEALALAARTPLDLALLDLHLPDMDGIELSRRLRALPALSGLPVIACTGFVDLAQKAREARAAFAEILEKPIGEAALLRMIQRFLPLSEGPGDQPGAGRVVLVADDDPTTRNFLARRLTALGFRVLTATDGADALAQARRTPPDALVTDVLMPHLDGIALCLAVRQDRSLAHLPTILTTASDLDDVGLRLTRDVGADAVVQRTADGGPIVDALMRALRDARSHRPTSLTGTGLPPDYLQHFVRQFERQATLGSELARKSAVQSVVITLLSGIPELLTRHGSPGEFLREVLPRLLKVLDGSAAVAHRVVDERLDEPWVMLGLSGTAAAVVHAYLERPEVLRRLRAGDEPLVLATSDRPADAVADLLAATDSAFMLILPLRTGDALEAVIALGFPSECLAEESRLLARAIMRQLAQALTIAATRQRLAASEERYQDLVNGLDAIVWEADPTTWSYTYLNRAAEVILGYPLERFLAEERFWVEHLHPEDRDRVMTATQDAMRVTGDVSMEYRMLAADGRAVWFHDRMRVHRRPDGGLARLTGVMVDISARKLAEAETRRGEDLLRQAQKFDELGRLAGGVAHDFNNLLSAIIGFSDLGLTRCAAEDPLRSYLTEILRAGERAAGLTGQLLTFSRKQVTETRLIDLNAVVREMTRLLARLIGENLELVVRERPQPTYVQGDETRLQQVVLNLVVNARDAMGASGQISVEVDEVELAHPSAGHAGEIPAGIWSVLRVRDTGCGMDAATRARLFEPYFTTKPEGKGTGLGLATVFGIVCQAGGNVRVESAPGSGTTFEVFFPRAEESTAEPAGERPQAPQTGSETVLVVEDEEMVRAAAIGVLRHCGYTVLEAPSGEAALELAAGAPKIDLLLSDVVMKGMSGRQLAERFAAAHPDTRVLLMSGYTDDALIRAGMEAGRIDLLAKPFGSMKLATKVREVLDRPRNSPPP